ncbi:MAG: hypothetical protein IJW97_05970, partial [Clostridia bacterium]|nr:hypothetical protein [Clostridia bacterium]
IAHGAAMAIRLGRGRRHRVTYGQSPYADFLSPISLFGTKKWDADCSVEWFVRSFFMCKGFKKATKELQTYFPLERT